jgi:hypothetical protein
MDRYDNETGQVFRETIIRPNGRIYTPWEHFRPSAGKEQQRHKFKSPHGSDSMSNTVMRRIVNNASMLNVDILKATPAAIVEKIWISIQREYVPHGARMRDGLLTCIDFQIDDQSTPLENVCQRRLWVPMSTSEYRVHVLVQAFNGFLPRYMLSELHVDGGPGAC